MRAGSERVHPPLRVCSSTELSDSGGFYTMAAFSEVRISSVHGSGRKCKVWCALNRRHERRDSVKMAVLFETSLGDIVIDLYTEERPGCCLNFLKLCKLKFYNFCLFHSVQRDFIAQGGDPEGTGGGGQSIWGVLKGDNYKLFEAEVAPRIKHKKLGTVSMVDNGSGYHTSQFFITLRENLSYLDGKHTVFGEV